MTTNESPRAKSSAISAAIGGLPGGIAVVAAGELDARSGGDTVAGRATVAAFAIDPTADAPVLETAPAAVLITVSLATDTELCDGIAFSGVASSRGMGLWARASGKREATAAEGGCSASAGTGLDKFGRPMECRVLTSVPRLPVPEPPIICSGASKENPMPKKIPIITAASAPTKARYARSELSGLLRDTGCCASSSSDSVVNIGSGISRRALFAVTAVVGRTPAGILPTDSWCGNENVEGSVPYVQLSRDTEARVADTIGEASFFPEGMTPPPLPLVVSAAETVGRTLPMDWRRVSAAAASSACRYSRSVITGIDAWVSAGASAQAM